MDKAGKIAAAFVATAVSGFFMAAGSDAYGYVKQKLKESKKSES